MHIYPALQPLRAPKEPCTSSIASWKTTNCAGTMVTTPKYSIILGWTPAGNLVSYKTPQVSQTRVEPQRHSRCTLNWCRCLSPPRSPWRWGGDAYSRPCQCQWGTQPTPRAGPGPQLAGDIMTGQHLAEPQSVCLELLFGQYQ